jgi:hypothetical protein
LQTEKLSKLYDLALSQTDRSKISRGFKFFMRKLNPVFDVPRD